MGRGSRPGERRGGRKRYTPNRRTILIDRILSIGLDHPTASRRAFLLKLVKDQKLPADTRMAVASKCFPPKRTQSSRTGRPRALADIQTTIAQEAVAEVGSAGAVLVPAMRDWDPRALDALLGIVQDATACPKARRKAALKIAEFLLPKAGKKAKLIPDEYGFSISPSLATAYRDNELELRALVNEPTRIIPAIAEKIKKLEARSKAIRRRLQVPCPTKYGRDDVIKDYVRLMRIYSAPRQQRRSYGSAEGRRSACEGALRCVRGKPGDDRAPPMQGAGGRGTAVQNKSIDWRIQRSSALAQRPKRS